MSDPSDRKRAIEEMTSYAELVKQIQAEQRKAGQKVNNEHPGYAEDLKNKTASTPWTGKITSEKSARFDNRHHPYARSQKTNSAHEPKRLCGSFTQTGECRRHGCQKRHDPEKMAICKTLIYKGSCSDEFCAVSHEPSPHNMPSCLHFQQGRCTKDDCRFIHVNVGREATNCVAFGTLGYCEKGSACTELHLRECPFFSNKGFCHWKDSCRPGHVHRASRMKKSSLSKAPCVEATGPPTPPFAAQTSLLSKAPYVEATGPPTPPFAVPSSLLFKAPHVYAPRPPTPPVTASPSLSKARPVDTPGQPPTSPIAASEAQSIGKKSQISSTPPDFTQEPNYIPFEDSDDE